MRVYNLTDAARLGKPLAPQTLRILGREIKPGKHVDLPDDTAMSEFSGWMWAGWVSVDHLPSWYQTAKRTPPAPPEPPTEAEVVEEPPEKTKESKKSKRGKKRKDTAEPT